MEELIITYAHKLKITHNNNLMLNGTNPGYLDWEKPKRSGRGLSTPDDCQIARVEEFIDFVKAGNKKMVHACLNGWASSVYKNLHKELTRLEAA